MSEEEYTAKNIKIDKAPKFAFTVVANLTDKYPERPAAWITRNVQCCYLLGGAISKNVDYFEDRYLKRLKVDANDAYEEMYLEVLKEYRESLG